MKITEFTSILYGTANRYRDKHKGGSVRHGQAMMNILPSHLYDEYTGTEYDCFYNDDVAYKLVNHLWERYKEDYVARLDFITYLQTVA